MRLPSVFAMPAVRPKLSRPAEPHRPVQLSGVSQAVVSEADNLCSGLIFGGGTPICVLRYKLREALFKDFWSDDTKNKSAEENRAKEYPGREAWPGPARRVRPHHCAAGGDEAVLGARLRGHVVQRPDRRNGD